MAEIMHKKPAVAGLLKQGLVFGLNPEGMDEPREITQQSQEDVNKERPTDTFPQQYAKRRQNDSKNDSPESHSYSCSFAGVVSDLFLLSLVAERQSATRHTGLYLA